MAATTLTPGDIAIVGFNFDNADEFAFTPLIDIGAGTEIKFTDNGWEAAGTFRDVEGTFTWTAPTDIAAGTIINPAVSSILFSASGDQIIAYQGDSSNPTFIYAVNSEGNPGIWQSDSTSSNTSALPTGLVNGETAVALDEVDNAIYTGITSGTQAELLAAIGDNSNWSGSNSTRQTMPTNPFTVSAGSVLNSLVFNEVLPDPNSSGANNFDTDGDGTAETGDEFVEIYNTSGSTLDIGGLQFWDAGSDNYFTIPGGTMLGANGFVVVVSDVGGGSLPTVPSGSFAFSVGAGGSGILSNSGDNLVLYDPTGDEYIQAVYNGDGTDDPTATYTGFSATATQIGSVLDFGNDTDGVSLALSPDGTTGNPVQHNTIGGGTVLATPGDSNVASGTTLAIAPTTQNEGDSGTTAFTFTVTRSGGDTSGTTTVEFATSDGTAIDGGDYTGTSGTVTFNPGDISETITVNVIGDTDVEADENFTVTLFNASGGATLSTASADGTIQNDDTVSFTLIHDIQGSGTASPLDGNTVTIEAIVVGDFQDGDGDTGRNLQGFYVQEQDGDADGNALTSEGIFIFERGDFITDVNVGDLVQVTGTVDEFFGETQIDTVTNITVVSSGNTLPTAASISFPAAATTTNQDGDLQPDLEAFEGMLVTFPDTLTVAEMFQLDRFNEIKLSQGGRPEQFTQNNAPSVAGYAAHLEDIGSRTITYDDGLDEQNADIGNLDGFGPTFNTATDIRMGDTITNLSGVLSYQWAGNSASGATWRVRSAVDGENTFTKVNNRPEIPDSVGGSLTVASLNVLNYFTTIDDGISNNNNPLTAIGQEPRGADDLSLASPPVIGETEFERQTEKLVETLLTLDADIVGLVELENDFQAGSSGNAIENLINELNILAGPGAYAWVDPGTQFVGDDAIAVGVIYKTSTVDIASGTSVEILTDSDLPGLGLGSLPAVFDGPSTNRSPLAVTFEEKNTGEAFTVVVNHLKSKGSPGTAGAGDNDGNDGAGNANQTRLNGATALDAWLDSDPTGSGDSDFLILGDLNAYAEEDPITFLEGEGYTDLAQQFLGSDAYSFVFDGQTGTLDYALANSSLLSQVTGTTEWHINADEPDAIDYNLDFGRDDAIFDGTVPYRASDHDPVIVGLDLSAPEIDVLGNNLSIADGDSTPATADHTDFGSQDIASGTVSRTFTIENTGSATLTLPGNPVSITGANASDFTVTQPSEIVLTLSPGGSSNFSIEFDPSAAGLRTAEVSIVNDDSDENPFNFTIQGMGTATPGVTITETSGTTVAEGGVTDTYMVVLDAQPTGNVTVNITPDSQTTVNSAILTFTSSNWDTPQTVTVTADDDSTVEGTHTSTITHAIAPSSASEYLTVSINNVTVNITDNDFNDITGGPGGQTVTGTSGPDRFVYDSILDGGDTIANFTPSSDKIDLTTVLSQIGYSGSDPIADSYLSFTAFGSHTIIWLDVDGTGTRGVPRGFLLVQNITPAAMGDLNNFVI